MSVVRQPVTERTQAAEARRAAADLARQLDFDETLAGKVAIAVTEAGNNLATHASGGELLLAAVCDHRGSALEMLAVDHGPGMDVDKCLRDGYSSAGTSGTGLGAIQRLSNAFDAWSDPNGSVIYARFSADAGADTTGFTVGCARAPKRGEKDCGDDWGYRATPEGAAVLVSDGLGHGYFAAEASRQAVAAFLHPNWRGPVATVDALHGALRGSRGASVAIAELGRAQRSIAYSGLGNIAGAVIHSAGVQRLVSHNGTAGHNASRIAGFQYAWTPESILVLHSDGLTSHWTLAEYPGILRRHPAVIAGVLYRDHSRDRDDVTVLVLRQDS